MDIGDVEMTNDQRKQLDDLFTKHCDAFISNDDDIGFTTTIKHPIRLSDNIPIRVPHRRIAPNQLDEVKRHIQKLLNQGHHSEKQQSLCVGSCYSSQERQLHPPLRRLQSTQRQNHQGRLPLTENRKNAGYSSWG